MKALTNVEPAIRGASVSVRDLRKRYGSVEAVSGVSLEARAGEFLSLLGPSGSGKTTLLMAIAGFEKLSSGSIAIDGRDVTAVPPHRRGLGMVFQKYALFPHLTVSENVAYPLRRRRVAEDELQRRVAEALSMIRLEGYGGRLPAELSGGQQQRVALARAIVYRPSVLLMDEPLGALDKKLREHMQLEVKHLQRQLGATVIYVTHDQDEALSMSDRVAVLRDGRLEQLGPPEELFEAPANTFVADFIGGANLLRGKIEMAVDHGRLAVALDGGPRVLAALGPGQQRPPPGATVELAIRPERISFEPQPVGASEPDGYSVVVTETVYAGASVTCIAEMGSVRVAARIATDKRRPIWQAGDHLLAKWKPEDALVYPI